MIVLEKRQHPSLWMGYLSPLLSIVLTFVVAAMVVSAMGKDPLRVLSLFTLEPLNGKRAIGEVMLKATPLILCSLGLAFCFRSNVWNIGAEGQFLLGAIGAGGMAMWLTETGLTEPGWLWVTQALLLGALAGAAWAAI
ncbi:MAG: ABC transporter permease subunit, partial [Burkholderiaceae bacterium]